LCSRYISFSKIIATQIRELGSITGFPFCYYLLDLNAIRDNQDKWNDMKSINLLAILSF